MSELFSLSGKSAVVVGGAGLIGKALVKGLVKVGAKVYAADIDGDAGKKLEEEIPGTTFVELDITKAESVKACIARVVKENGGLDVWVNSAYPRTSDWGAKLEDVKLESFRKNVDMHLNGYFLCCQLAAEQMKKQKNGAIINFGSIYGIVGPDFSLYEKTNRTVPVAYSAIKGGIVNLTRYFASYYAKDGVRINAVCPGGISNKQEEGFLKEYGKRTPMGRMGKADEMVGPVVFLASEASSYVTGHILIVDGGWTTV